MNLRADEQPSSDVGGGVNPRLVIAGVVLRRSCIVFIFQNRDRVRIEFLCFSFTSPLWLILLIVAVLAALLDERRPARRAQGAATRSDGPRRRVSALAGATGLPWWADHPPVPGAVADEQVEGGHRAAAAAVAARMFSSQVTHAASPATSACSRRDDELELLAVVRTARTTTTTTAAQPRSVRPARGGCTRRVRRAPTRPTWRRGRRPRTRA